MSEGWPGSCLVENGKDRRRFMMRGDMEEIRGAVICRLDDELHIMMSDSQWQPPTIQSSLRTIEWEPGSLSGRSSSTDGDEGGNFDIRCMVLPLSGNVGKATLVLPL